jgi:hypothetical protein
VRWILVVAAAVAIAAAAAAVAVGREAVSPKPLEAGLVALEDLSWAERASAECVDYMRSVRAAVAGPVAEYETQAARAARLYAETTQIERSLVAELRAIPGAPPDAARTLDLFHARNVRDLEVAAALQQSFDAQLLQRELTAYERTATQLRQRFRSHGATGCVAYLDPDSYED